METFFDEMLSAKLAVGGGADGWVLRRQRTASNQVTAIALPAIDTDASPQQTEHGEIAMLLMHAGASKFDEFIANRLERFEQEFLRAVIAAIAGRARAGLQAIRPDDFAGRRVFHQKMIANFIKVIGIQASREGMLEAFVEFEIENQKTKRLRGANFLRGARQAQRVRPVILRAGQDPVANGICDVRFHMVRRCDR